MAENAMLDISLVLPELKIAANACADRLVKSLEGRSGVMHAHIVRATDMRAAQLCVHYDPDLFSILKIRDVVIEAGAKINAHYGYASFEINTPIPQDCVQTLGERIKTIVGVLDLNVTASGLVWVEFDREQTDQVKLWAIIAELRSAFKIAANGDHPNHDHGPSDHDHAKGEHNHSEGGLFGPNT